MGMITSPGNLSDAEKTCGNCHPDQAAGVMKSVMHTGKNIVTTTRAVIEPGQHFEHNDFQHLGHGIADSMLRKLCSSCHLGQKRSGKQPDAVKDRGGGCLACHLNDLPDDQHPVLTRKVEDGRCFGCHSRSGRIALNYAGLAEVQPETAKAAPMNHARLADGRTVVRTAADIHHQAGMACIDCHTGTGLMNLHAGNTSSGPDISCNDCHANSRTRLSRSTWPGQYATQLSRVPFQTKPEQEFLQTKNGTPLTHIQITGNQLLLYPRLGGAPLAIPQAKHQGIESFAQHEKLTCNSCHTRWIPTCLGCHMHYDPDGKQWDHSAQQFTSGTWHERRWQIRTGPATLGKRDAQTIDVFLPGMIMTLAHPDLDTTRFIRRFAPIAPHTTGHSVNCVDCHQSSTAVGLGSGRLQHTNGKLDFTPAMPNLADELPADAWTGLQGKQTETNIYPRPFTATEIKQLYEAVKK